jgi:hypothetical protein
MSNFPEAPIDGALAEVLNTDGSAVQYKYDKAEAAWKIVGKVGGSDLEIVTTKDVVTTAEPPLAPAGWTGFNVQEDIQYLTNQKLVNWFLAEQIIKNHNRPPIINPGEPILHPDLPGSPDLINGDIWVDGNNNIYIYLNGEWVGIISSADFIADQLRQDNNINELTKYLQGLIDSGVPIDGTFVKKEGGDSMEGPLLIIGGRNADADGLESTVIALNIDSGQNSSLNLKHNGSTKVYIGENQTSIQGDIKLNSGSGTVVKSNVQDLLNIGEREIAYLGESIEDEDLVTKKYVDNKVIELEEEIDAIAPSIERGKWTFTAVGTVGQPGQFTMYDAEFGNGQPTGLFKSAKSIWFNEIDSDGTPHAFADIDDGELLEIFVDGSPEYGLYEVVGQAHDETQGASSFWVIDVNFVRSLEATTAVGPGELCRFKVFMAPTGGDASSFVMKTGDEMTGRLVIESETELADFTVPTNNDARIEFKNLKPSNNAESKASIYIPGAASNLACSSSFHATSFSTANTLYGYQETTENDGRKKRVSKYPRIQFLSDSSDADNRSKDYGLLKFNSKDRLKWHDNGGEIYNDTGSILQWNTSYGYLMGPGTDTALTWGKDGVVIFRDSYGSLGTEGQVLTRSAVGKNLEWKTAGTIQVLAGNPPDTQVGDCWFNTDQNTFIIKVA